MSRGQVAEQSALRVIEARRAGEPIEDLDHALLARFGQTVGAVDAGAGDRVAEYVLLQGRAAGAEDFGGVSPGASDLKGRRSGAVRVPEQLIQGSVSQILLVAPGVN